jgi:predicted alpha/beta-fold hydrolase
MHAVALDAHPAQSFRPFPLLANPHLQTVVAAHVGLPCAPPSVTRLVRLPDTDRIALEVSTPTGWRPTDPTVVLLHGVCGSHRSSYMQRLARKLWRRGVRAIRMNMRGCGSGHGLARQPYHGGQSADVLAVLQGLHQDSPRSPTTVIGFSLGGNIVLKLAGELRESAREYLERVIAVCAPADLVAAARLLTQPRNRLYNLYFAKLLVAAAVDRHARFADLPPVRLPAGLTVYDFDTLYTAPQCGFRDALDYYQRCSAAPLVPQITIPCALLFSADDPVIDATVLDDVALPPNVQVVCTPHGGHMGFLGRPHQGGGYRMLDAQLLAWLAISPSPRTPRLMNRAEGRGGE